jgi:subtilase family serine protease
MNSRRTAFFALFVALLLTVSGSFGVTLFSASFASSSQSTAIAPNTLSSNLDLNGSSVTIPISLPSEISLAGSGGSVPPTTQISLSVLISSRNPVGLQEYVNELNNPQSSEYRQYLNPQTYAKLYGPDTTEVNSLTSYFTSKGLQTAVDSSNPSLVHVSGDAFQIESALKVSLDSFRVANQSFY